MQNERGIIKDIAIFLPNLRNFWSVSVITQYVRYIPYRIYKHFLEKNQFLCLGKRIMSLRNFNFSDFSANFFAFVL